MKEEVKQLWLAALRSGQYLQGKYRLRHDIPDRDRQMQHTYCCLGVLCETYRVVTGKGHWQEDGLFVAQGDSDSSRASLPASVTDWAGLSSPDPVIGTEKLSKYNDGYKKDDGTPEGQVILQDHSFPEIANLIEANL